MKSIPEQLRAAGLRSTGARQRVLQAIEDMGAPAAHAQLAEHALVAGMDPVTLYRTLATLEEAHLLHRVQGTDGAWRYCPQPATEGCPGGHAHFQCLTCGRISCLVDQPIPHISVPEGAQVRGRQLLAFGHCPDCAC